MQAVRAKLLHVRLFNSLFGEARPSRTMCGTHRFPPIALSTSLAPRVAKRDCASASGRPRKRCHCHAG